MSATVQEVAALADVQKFFKETDVDYTYGQCHNALTWLCIQIKKADLPDYNIWLCVGEFAGNDHSWMQVEDTNDESQTIIDMTVDQFGVFKMPYVGPVCPGYEINHQILLSDQDNLAQFLSELG
jgi:hypothetical protein